MVCAGPFGKPNILRGWQERATRSMSVGIHVTQDFPRVQDSIVVFCLCFGMIWMAGMQSFGLTGRHASMLVQVSLILIPVLYCKIRGWKIRHVFCLNPPRIPDLLAGTFLAAGLQLSFWIAGSTMLEYVSHARYASVSLASLAFDTNFLFSFLILVLAPAIGEEFLFRGFIASGFSSIGRKATVILGSLFFALIHLDIYRLLFVFIAGIVFGIVREKTQSLYVVMWMHFVHNSIPFVLLRTSSSFAEFVIGSETNKTLCFIGGLLLCAVGIIGFSAGSKTHDKGLRT